MDTHLKALCLAVLTNRISTDRFTDLLVQTGIRLDTIEWDVANKILEKGDEIRHALGRHSETLH